MKTFWKAFENKLGGLFTGDLTHCKVVGLKRSIKFHIFDLSSSFLARSVLFLILHGIQQKLCLWYTVILYLKQVFFKDTYFPSNRGGYFYRPVIYFILK
jgi:hypothetical protein